jgi:hypothetical protein
MQEKLPEKSPQSAIVSLLSCFSKDKKEHCKAAAH